MKTKILFSSLPLSACQALSTTGKIFAEISDHTQDSATNDNTILDENVFKCGRSQSCKTIAKRTNGNQYETVNLYEIQKSEFSSILVKQD